MDTGNPILDRGFAVAGQTRHLTCIETPSAEKPRKVPQAIQKMVSELGLRYRPSSQADLEAHAATLALLAVDLADVPPHLLARAIAKHVLLSPYLPKASELIKLAQSFVAPPPPDGPDGETWGERANRRIASKPERLHPIHWVSDGNGSYKLEYVKMPTPTYLTPAK